MNSLGAGAGAAWV